MTRRLPLIALALLLLAAGAQSAQARTTARPTSERYTIQGTTTQGALKVNWRAYALLPTKLPDVTSGNPRVLRFGPIGSCRFNLSISGRVVARTEGESSTARVAAALPAQSQYVYTQGTRDSAAWRIIRVKGSANVRGMWALPVNLRTTNAFGGPTQPAWLEVSGTANEHTQECHSGGPRYIRDTLAQAFGAMTGTAFSTDLPRLPLPPKPASS